MELPPRDDAAEDAFVETLLDADAEWLLALVEDAMAARRVRLAARLVGLVPPDGAVDPVVERARRAASLVLHRQLGPGDVSWSELQDAVDELRRGRVSRAKERQRRASDGDRESVRRGDGRRVSARGGKRRR